MSDYVYARKFDRNGCPKCGGDNSRTSKWKFRCEECHFAFP